MLRIAKAIGLGLTACAAWSCSSRDPVAPALREEAAAVVRTVEDLRQASNQDKAGRLQALDRAPCTQPDICALKGRCAEAYRSLLGAMSATAAVQSAFDSPNAALQLAQAEQDLSDAKRKMLGCATAQDQLSRRYRL
jgi:hypothetical protein